MTERKCRLDSAGKSLVAYKAVYLHFLSDYTCFIVPALLPRGA